MKTIVKQALRELEVDGDRRTAVAQFRFDEDLEVFEGHFPNNPLVPGIFLIEIARCVAERIADSTLDIVEVIDAKFTAQVGPRMTIVATVSLSENTQLSPDDVVSPADGMLRCDARLTTSDIDYISAHATSTPLGDRAEAMTYMYMDPFEKWVDLPVLKRGAEYEAFKKGIADRMLGMIAKHAPELYDCIDQVYCGTPLSDMWYAHNERGGVFGISHDISQQGTNRPMIRMRLRNLFFTGHSITMPGICGTFINAFDSCDMIRGDDRLFDQVAT